MFVCWSLFLSGEADLDKIVETDVTIKTLETSVTGFQAWERNGEARGTADYLFSESSANSKVRILFLHGGGYKWYSPQDVYRPLTSRIAKRTGMPVLAIDYRKAPEFAFPGAVHDAVQALEWLQNNGPNGSEKADGVLLIGDSAGGGLVLSTLLALLEDGFGGKDVTCLGAAVISPFTDLTCSGDSYATRLWNAESLTGDPIFSDGNDEHNIRASSIKAVAPYVGETPAHHHLVSPLFAPNHRLEKLPPVLLIVGDAEVMLDDTVQFAKRLQDCGARVETKVYDRMWHVWVMYTEGCGGGRPLKDAEEGLDHIASFCKKNSNCN